jgi:hypothetical protein
LGGPPGPRGTPSSCTDYDIVQPPKDAGPDTIDWDRFIANAPMRCPRFQLLILDLIDPISEIDWAANRRYTVT